MFFEKAHEGRNAWWRWLLTIAGMVAAWLAGQIPLLLFVVHETRMMKLDPEAFFGGGFPAGVDRNLHLLLSLLPFVTGFLALWLLIRVLHGKSLRSVMTGPVPFPAPPPPAPAAPP